MQGFALPFSSERFFEVFADYNSAIWPVQIVATAVGVMAIAALWLRPNAARVAVFVALALLWGWTGGVYHIAYFARINRAAIGFGALFIVQAFLFLAYALRGRGLALSRRAPARVWAWLLIGYALLVYPLLGMLSGHAYPAAPVFGVTPCPLVIFTFGMLLFGEARTPWPLFAIPALWSVIGGSAAFLLGVYPDWTLPLSAVIAIGFNWSKGVDVSRRA